MPTDPHTRRLVERAKRAPKQSSEEEIACIVAWQQHGNRSAADRIIDANMRHVVFTALKFRSYGVPVADLIGDGNVGLMKALERFDTSRGVRFSTYAVYWIRAEMIATVMGSWRMLSGPSGALHSRFFFRLRRARARLSGELSPSVVRERMAESFGMSERRMEEMLGQIDNREVSLDAESSGTNLTLLEQLPSPNDQARELEIAESRQWATQLLDEARADLDTRELYILDRRLLAFADEKLSLATIGEHFGISRERVRQLEVRTRTKVQRRILAGESNPAYREWAA